MRRAGYGPAMDPLVIALIVGAVLARLISIRLWRAGRISDRTMALLSVGRFPVIGLLFGLIVGLDPVLLLALVAGSLLVAAIVAYPTIRDLLADPDTRR